MRFRKTFACLLLLALTLDAAAQEIPVAGIAAGQSEHAAMAAIDAACKQVTRIDVPGTRFPEATRSEVHVRCTGLTLSDGRVGGDAIFTFADDKLVMFEARGASRNLTPAGDPAANVAGFSVFLPQQLVIDTARDRAVVFASFSLAPIALHWDNPAWRSDQVAAPAGAFFLPPEVEFGAGVDAMTALLEKRCAIARGKPIEKVWLATEPARQYQIDCYGYEMAGYPRKFEFVFGDGVLQQMWLLFGEADIPRLRAFLTAKFGAPLRVDEDYEVFDDWRISLRKDVPEIRMASDAIARIWARE